MKSTTRSLLEELEQIADHRDHSSVIENRANNIIASAINLLEMISQQYTEEQYAVLERKLLGAIKNKDRGRFSKSLRKTNEAK